jgi:hypothetical protein
MSKSKVNPFIEIYKKSPPTHGERTHGWTRQKSTCGFAVWWDCSFWCSNPKLNPTGKIFFCRTTNGCLGVPNFEKCKKMRRKLEGTC